MLAQAFLTGRRKTRRFTSAASWISSEAPRVAAAASDFIVEACEFHSSFLHFHPTIAVVLNIDADHLDYFHDLDHIEQTFAEYVALVPENGWCVAWGDDPRARRVCLSAKCRSLTYGLGEDCDLRAADVSYDEHGFASFTAVLNGETLGRFHMGVASKANMLDGLAVIAVAHIRGLDMEKVADALSHFIGAHRRFELTSITDGVRCYTDYGHNPAEIKNAIQIAVDAGASERSGRSGSRTRIRGPKRCFPTFSTTLRRRGQVADYRHLRRARKRSGRYLALKC